MIKSALSTLRCHAPPSHEPDRGCEDHPRPPPGHIDLTPTDSTSTRLRPPTPPSEGEAKGKPHSNPNPALIREMGNPNLIGAR